MKRCVARNFCCLFSLSVLLVLLPRHGQASSIAGTPLVIRHPTPPANPIYSKGYSYFLDLLHLALSQQKKSYLLQPVEVPIVPDSRSMVFLKQNKYDVMWLHTSNERESELRPVRIPVFKGMIGWRLFLVNQQSAERLQSLDSSTLKSLHAGLGHDWPDVAIMKHNGFAVRTAISWNTVVNLLSQGRVDYFPRAINEVWRELAETGNQKIVLDTKFALHYRSAYYLFVAKDNEALALVLEEGLQKALTDGSFDRLFYAYFGNNILTAQLPRREIIYLENPELPRLTPVWRDELWLKQDDALKLENRIMNSPQFPVPDSASTGSN